MVGRAESNAWQGTTGGAAHDLSRRKYVPRFFLLSQRFLHSPLLVRQVCHVSRGRCASPAPPVQCGLVQAGRTGGGRDSYLGRYTWGRPQGRTGQGGDSRADRPSIQVAGSRMTSLRRGCGRGGRRGEGRSRWPGRPSELLDWK